jgi:Na+-translocating ferredoxin:NAD+ oxidoreductase subunit A
MAAESLTSLFFNAFLTNNFVLAMFLGLCPFLGTSAKNDTALNMGVATTIVMLISSVCAYGINAVLQTYQLEFLRLISYIAVIAAAVQLVEMFLKKTSPLLSRALGIYLPLITTNCAVLGVALIQTNKGYNFLEALIFSLGAGLGFALALLLMAGLREKLELANLPSVAQSAGLSMILAGILSLTFMGFAGLG